MNRTFFFEYVLFLIGIIGLAIIPLNSDAQIRDTITADLSSDPFLAKTIPLGTIQESSRITDASITISMEMAPNEKCRLQLIDPALNRIDISDSFSCNGQHLVNLNQAGRYATEYNLSRDKINIGVSTIDGKVLEFFDAGNISISYVKPTYYAEIENNTVVNVVVADQSFIRQQPGQWVQVYPETANYPGIGFAFNPLSKNFTEPQPFPSWSLGKDNHWTPPVPKPNDLKPHRWNEQAKAWSP